MDFRDWLDGTSTTLLAAEVKAWTPYNRNGGRSMTMMPTSQAEAEAVVASDVHYSNAGQLYEQSDYNSWQEGRDGNAGNPTHAMITTRSYHNGLVNAAMVDGSIKSITESIELHIWHALGTRSEREVISGVAL